MLFKRDEILLLFDVDGTLTHPRTTIEKDFEEFLYNKIRPLATIGIVGGSDLEKMYEQLNGNIILKKFDYIFPENGLVQIENGIEVNKESITNYLGEEILQKFLNYVLNYLSRLTLPFKRGTFIEYRNGMMNICPVGRQCTVIERNLFAEYDKIHNIREIMINDLKREFNNIDLTYSIGGQISFDVFPHGWDKTYCLKHFQKTSKIFKEIHFFGDKTEPGGNDYELYTHSSVIGHKVKTPNDTRTYLNDLFNL